MTPLMQFVAETPQDPIWLRTLATVLPIVGSIVIAVISAPKLIERFRQKKAEREANHPPADSPAVQVAVAATERAATDPIVRLFIDDLHQRLNLAHEEAAELHRLRAVDAGTIARLTAEIADKEERLDTCEQELANKTTQNRSLIRRLEELKRELDTTRRKLAECLEGKQP